jgi:hypothetical protein
LQPDERYELSAALQHPPGSLLVGWCLAEQGKLMLVGDLRAEHPQHPVQLLLFVSIRRDRMPQSA